MSDELKACGHCGEYAVKERGVHYSWVRCIACSAATEKYDTIDEAIAAWNRRVVTRFTFDLMAGSLYMNAHSTMNLDVEETRELTMGMLRAAGLEVAE